MISGLPATRLSRRISAGIVASITASLGFWSARLLRLLVPLAIGAPPSPRSASTRTRGVQLRDYFKVNTDHKVIGIQYCARLLFFSSAG